MWCINCRCESKPAPVGLTICIICGWPMLPNADVDLAEAIVTGAPLTDDQRQRLARRQQDVPEAAWTLQP